MVKIRWEYICIYSKKCNIISRSAGERWPHVSVGYGVWHVAWLPISSAADSAFRNRGGKVIHQVTRADASVAYYSITLQHNAITHEDDGKVAASQAHTSFWFITLITWFTLFISHRIWSYEPWLRCSKCTFTACLGVNIQHTAKALIPHQTFPKVSAYFSGRNIRLQKFLQLHY